MQHNVHHTKLYFRNKYLKEVKKTVNIRNNKQREKQ